MRQNFDPFADCKIGPTKNEIHTLWVQAAVGLIVELAYAYDVLKNNGSNVNDLLTGIGHKLDEIRLQMAETNYYLRSILEMIRNIPEVVRGVVEESLIKQALGEADGIVQVIQEASASEGLILQDPQRLSGKLDELRIKVNGVRALGGGMTGLMMIAPYLSSWLAGATAYQKVKLSSDKNWILTSPWSTPFWRTMDSAIQKLFIDIDRFDQEFEVDIKKSPPHEQLLVVKSGEFVTALPTPSPSALYRLTCTPERLQTLSIQLPGRPEKWTDVLPSESQHAAAINALILVKEKRNVISDFYTAVPDLYTKKTEILKVFIEPTNYWA